MKIGKVEIEDVIIVGIMIFFSIIIMIIFNSLLIAMLYLIIGALLFICFD